VDQARFPRRDKPEALPVHPCHDHEEGAVSKKETSFDKALAAALFQLAYLAETVGRDYAEFDVEAVELELQSNAELWAVYQVGLDAVRMIRKSLPSALRAEHLT
jgi:hypothetical protein